MPHAVSKKQYRMMRAIAEGHSFDHPRGTPPKKIAQLYVNETHSAKDLPENHGENTGGTWSSGHHEAHKKGKSHGKEKENKKNKHKIKKSFEEFYKGQAAVAFVLDTNGRILLGQHMDTKSVTAPGGHLEGNESHELAALRELKEETGLTGRNPQKVLELKTNGNNTQFFLVESFSGNPKSTAELKNLKWYEPHEIPWSSLRDCCIEPLHQFVENKLGKTLKGMVSLETLEKNIIRQRGDAVFEMSHGDALRVVGTGLFKRIKSEVKGMTDESFKDFKIDTHTVHIRKHMNDVYSGRVIDGHKQVYQFTNKSLPEVTAALMSVFEWYVPEDENVFDSLDSLSDDVVRGGISHLIDAYKRHNIGNIYDEMEDIREKIRNGVAVDLQQVEARLMKLFDQLEQLMHDLAEKHNKLADDSGKDIDILEEKLRDLQSKIDQLSNKPEVVEAYSTNPKNPSAVHREEYPYLPKPTVDIEPSGRIRISFAADWSHLEKENFLKDMRVKIIGKSQK